MVSVLARIFGLRNLEAIEDAIQDALIRAMEQWTFKGIPDNPRAWLIEVSKNRILDHLRRRNKFESPQDDLETAMSTANLGDGLRLHVQPSGQGAKQARTVFVRPMVE